MNRVLLFIIPLFPFCCFGQEDGVLPQTTTYIAETSDGHTMSITLYPNGRYDFTTYWMQYHGKYEITVSSYSDFDYIGFYDDNIDFEGYFYYRYDYDTEALSKLYTLDSLQEQNSVMMFDLDGEPISFHYVCFSDSNDNVFHCVENTDSSLTSYPIPSRTKNIEMLGRKNCFDSKFRCNYNESQGNAYILIGPCPNSFQMSKNLYEITYRLGESTDKTNDKCIVFKKEE